MLRFENGRIIAARGNTFKWQPSAVSIAGSTDRMTSAWRQELLPPPPPPPSAAGGPGQSGIGCARPCSTAAADSHARDRPNAHSAASPATLSPSSEAMLLCSEMGAATSAVKRARNSGRYSSKEVRRSGAPRAARMSGRMPGISGVPSSTSAIMSRNMTAVKIGCSGTQQLSFENLTNHIQLLMPTRVLALPRNLAYTANKTANRKQTFPPTCEPQRVDY